MEGKPTLRPLSSDPRLIRLCGRSMRLEIVKRLRSGVLWMIGGLSLLVVLAATVSVDSSGDHTRPAGARAQIAAFLVALDTYHSDVGEFPTEAQGLRALRVDPGVPGWDGPYLLRDVPADPWGVPYRYRLDGGRPKVISFGGVTPEGKRTISGEKRPRQ
jgi:type II secretion system protein G